MWQPEMVRWLRCAREGQSVSVEGDSEMAGLSVGLFGEIGGRT